MCQRVVTHESLQTGVHWAVVLLLLVAVAGCGSDGGDEPTDKDLVWRVVSDMSDVKSRPQAFQALFAEGAAPPESEREKYRPCMFRTVSVEVTGDTATMTVRVKDGTTDEILGEAEWTAVREGG